jgi:hypothetical protein
LSNKFRSLQSDSRLKRLYRIESAVMYQSRILFNRGFWSQRPNRRSCHLRG